METIEPAASNSCAYDTATLVYYNLKECEETNSPFFIMETGKLTWPKRKVLCPGILDERTLLKRTFAIAPFCMLS